MFRHLFDCYPSICIEDNSLKTILGNGVKHLEKLYEEWSRKICFGIMKELSTIFLKHVKGLKSPVKKRLSQFVHITRANPILSIHHFDG